MAIDINTELFKRFAPKKKLDIVSNLTEEEVRKVSMETITKIIKEVGERQPSYHFDKKTKQTVKTLTNDKSLFIPCKRRGGNDWNSTVDAVKTTKKELFVSVYFQMSDTDTHISVPFKEFFKRGEYHGKASEANGFGDMVPRYFTYDEHDKANVLKSFLTEYLYKKYADKLNF